MTYGFHYMGSKAKHAVAILAAPPRADTLREPFMGGGATTHCALLSRKYRRITGYKSLPIPPGAIVYCDPPHKGTRGYVRGFGHGEFYQWLRALPNIAVISEYAMPPDFVCVWRKDTACCLSSARAKKALPRQERLWVRRDQLAEYAALTARLPDRESGV